MDKPARINARLDLESSEQLRYLLDATGQGASDVVREGLALYYRQVKASRKGPMRFLALAGKGNSGHSNIASNWKRYWGAGLEEKHGLKPLPPKRRRS